MSKLVLKRRGVDDFGREQINGRLFQYSQHHPRVSPGDIILYFDKKERNLGMYIVIKETEYYYKDGFQYCKGTMNRFLDGDTTDFEAKIKKYYNNALADEFAKLVAQLVEELNN
jgi:hypothetical protein